MAEPGVFESKDTTPYGQEGFSKKTEAKGYEVIVDTKGKLLWPDAKDMEKPYLIITSEQVTKEYLQYLDRQNISWIACGKEKIDLVRAAEILKEEFHVEKMGIVGGPKINTAFLDAGLLDEISILIGPGIDGREEMLNILMRQVLPQLSVIIVISNVPQLCFKQLPATPSIHCTFYHF